MYVVIVPPNKSSSQIGLRHHPSDCSCPWMHSVLTVCAFPALCMRIAVRGNVATKVLRSLLALHQRGCVAKQPRCAGCHRTLCTFALYEPLAAHSAVPCTKSHAARCRSPRTANTPNSLLLQAVQDCSTHGTKMTLVSLTQALLRSATGQPVRASSPEAHNLGQPQPQPRPKPKGEARHTGEGCGQLRCILELHGSLSSTLIVLRWGVTMPHIDVRNAVCTGVVPNTLPTSRQARVTHRRHQTLHPAVSDQMQPSTTLPSPTARSKRAPRVAQKPCQIALHQQTASTPFPH